MNEEILQSDSYFDIKDTIDFNYPFNIVVGGRNIGKTFSAKLWWFERALKTDKPFISLVREVGEVESVANDYFDNQKEKGYLQDFEFYNYTLNNYARVLACKAGETERKISIILPLKKSDGIKRMSLEGTCGMFMDEMIPETGIYLRNEPNRLLSIYNTAMRGNDPYDYPVVMLGNACGYSSPYFGQWDIEVPEPGSTTYFKGLIKFTNLLDGAYKKGDVASVISRMSHSYSQIMNNSTLEKVPLGVPVKPTNICNITVGNRCLKYQYENGNLYFSLTEPTDDAIVGMDIYGNKPIQSVTVCRYLVMSIRRALSANKILFADNKTYSVVVEFVNLYK